jgi:hypothetical protein
MNQKVNKFISERDIIWEQELTRICAPKRDEAHCIYANTITFWQFFSKFSEY